MTPTAATVNSPCASLSTKSGSVETLSDGKSDGNPTGRRISPNFSRSSMDSSSSSSSGFESSDSAEPPTCVPLIASDCPDYVCRLSPDLQEFARRELGETPEVRSRSLAAMRHWLTTEVRTAVNAALIDNLEAKILLRFLRAHKFDVVKSCRTFQAYLQLRRDHPTWWQGWSPDEAPVVKLAECGAIFVLPDRDAFSRRVIVNCIARIDVASHNKDEIVRLMMMTVEALMTDEENQIRGISYIFDCKGLNLSYLSLWTPADAAVLMGRCEKNLAIRHSSVACVSLPFAFRAVLKFVKTFLSAKMRQRIAVLSSAHELMSVAAQQPSPYTVHADHLPMELHGRNVTSCSAMAKDWLHLTLGSEVVRHQFQVLDALVATI